MKTYQSALPGATPKGTVDTYDEQMIERVRVNLEHAFANGFFYCIGCEHTCQPEESDQGQPKKCNHCGSNRVQWNPPIWQAVRVDDVRSLNEAECIAKLEEMQATFTDADFDALEADLKLRAACLGWTGEPLKQPPHEILASALRVKGAAR